MIINNFRSLLIKFRFARKTIYFMLETNLIEQFKNLSQCQNN